MNTPAYQSIFTVVSINDQKICTLSFKSDQKQNNRFIARRWITFTGKPKTVKVFIGDDKTLLSELTLKTKDGQLFEASEGKEAFYYWGSLRKGKGETWGITIGYLDHTRQTNEPIEMSLPAAWKIQDEKTGNLVHQEAGR